MNKNLNIALKNRSSDQGFAIPVAVGLGLIMILLGVTMVVRSQGDQVTASAQKATNRGLGAAETGITQYQSLIQNNPAITRYKDCVGTRDASSGTCPDINPTRSWSNATAIPPVITASTLNSCTSGNGPSAVTAASAIASWRDISATNASLGQYRLVSYVYPAPGTTDTGQLTVEGRVNQADANNDGDDNDKADTSVGTATSKLQVNIPVKDGDNASVPFPGLWVSNTTNSGNTNASILAPCDQTNVAVTATPPNPNPNNYQTYRSSLAIPNTPTKPISNIKTLAGVPTTPLPLAADIVIHNADIAGNITNNSLSNFNWATGEYQYAIPSISLGGHDTLTFSPGSKVALYVDGNITMSGTPDIKHDCTAPGGASIPNCSPTDARIYGLSASGTLSLSGNSAICDVLFLAPNYTASVSGGGHAGSCNSGANNNGIYWIKAWTGGTSGPHVSLQQTSTTWDDVSFLFPLPPQIAPIASWQRQEASP